MAELIDVTVKFNQPLQQIRCRNYGFEHLPFLLELSVALRIIPFHSAP